MAVLQSHYYTIVNNNNNIMRLMKELLTVVVDHQIIYQIITLTRIMRRRVRWKLILYQ